MSTVTFHAWLNESELSIPWYRNVQFNSFILVSIAIHLSSRIKNKRNTKIYGTFWWLFFSIRRRTKKNCTEKNWRLSLSEWVSFSFLLAASLFICCWFREIVIFKIKWPGRSLHHWSWFYSSCTNEDYVLVNGITLSSENWDVPKLIECTYGF